MALSATTIATAISNLSVSGVTIKDLSTSPQEATRATLPALLPDIDNFGGDVAIEGGDGPLSFGTATTRFWMTTRSLGYIYYHAAIGANRNNPYQFLTDICNKRDLIIEALLELADTTDVDVLGITGGVIGIVNDLSGNQYHGFSIQIRVREKVNN